MSRPIAGRGNRSRAGKALAAPLLVLAVFVLSGVSPVGAQEQTPAAGPRVRPLLQIARDYYSRGDYEKAAFYYNQVKINEKDLAPAEINDLKNQILLNNEALRKQREGRDQLNKAEDLLRQGKASEAGNLVKSASLNQYLGFKERLQLAELSKQLRNPPAAPARDPSATKARALLKEGRALLAKADYQGAQAKAAEAERLNVVYMPSDDTHIQLYLDIDRARRTGRPPTASTGDPKALLTAARAAYQRGDLDSAEELAHQAEKANSGSWLNIHWPLSDTPAKVLHDVQVARAAKQAPPPPPASGSPFKSIRTLFSRGTSTTPDTKKPDGASPAPDAAAPVEGPTLNNPPTPGPSSMAPSASPSGVVQAADWTTQPADPGKEDHNAVLARQLVREGYLALHNQDLVRARKCAEQAKNLHAALNWWEDNPDKLMADIQRQTPLTTASGQNSKKTPGDGHALVREGRALLRDGKLEEADQVCARAAATSTSWGLFEDSPDKLRHDIHTEESVKLLANARKQFNQGKLQDARTNALRAQQLHGPYSIWDLGDRPQKLLAAIDRAEADLRKSGKAATEVADVRTSQSPAMGGKNGSTPAASDAMVKQRALALLAEARSLKARGQLVEARQKALAAQRVVAEAARPASLFGPDEDRPETALLQLASLCDARINALLQHASDCVTAGGGDPSRFQRAQSDLAQARQLAQAFGQDTVLIDHKATWLQETQAAGALTQGPRPAAPDLLPLPGVTQVAQVGNQTPPNKGKDLLDRARLELKSGQTAMARRLAVAAYEPAYGVQKEAEGLLRSIDAEEYNQARLTANRSADAGFEAFQHGDYQQAAAILRSVNADFLDPEKHARLKEISGTREMQPLAAASAPVKLSGLDFKAPSPDVPGMAHVSDSAGPGTGPAPDGLERLRILEEVQVQQLREEGLRAQRDANDRARAGEYAAAMDILRDFQGRLTDSHLDSDKVKVLNRQVEARLQQFRTLKAQRDFEKEQNSGLASATGSEHTREAEKRQRDAEIAQLLKDTNNLYHEGKYAQAKLKAEEAHELDPDNVAANADMRMIEMKTNIERAAVISKQKREFNMNALDDYPGPILDITKNPVSFSDDRNYVERIKIRKDPGRGIQSPTHNPIEQGIERKLYMPISPVNFKDVPLEQALDDLGTMSGLNFYYDRSALEAAGVNLQQPISFKQENISLKSALNLLLRNAKLTHMVKDETVWITTEEEAQGKNKQVTYPVADLVTPPADGTLPNSSNLAYQLEHLGGAQGVMNSGPVPYLAPTSMSGGTPVGSATGSMAGGSYRGLSPNPQATVVRPGQTIEDLLINLIKSTIAPNTWSDVGGKGTVNYFPIGSALVVNQTQDIQEQVADLLAALRRLQELEVAIEMKMITVSESFYEMIGVNFDVNIQNNNARFGSQLVTQNFQTAGQINNFSPTGFVSGLTPAGTLTPDLSIPITNSSFQFSQPPFGGFPGTLGMDGGLSLGLAFLSEIQVFMFLEAAQVDRRTNVMQAPKITVFNGQTANITVQDQQFFLTGVSLVQAGAQVFFVPTQQPFPLGVSLQVTPVVSADRRFVRVNLQPTLTNLASTNVPLIPVEIPVPQLFEGPGAATTVGGQPAIFQMFFQQPTFTQVSLNTTVSVPDGGTVLLGGLKTLSEGRVEAGPPILSKIPYINRLFTNTSYGRDSQSLLIMVTPRIIINEEEEQIFLGNLPPIPREQGP